MKRVLAIGLLALSTSAAMAQTMTSDDVKRTVNGMIANEAIYEEQCGPVPAKFRAVSTRLQSLADAAGVLAEAMNARQAIANKGKAWYCSMMGDMYAKGAQ